MAVVTIDAKGLKCPRPTLEMTVKAKSMNTGDVMEVVADCPTFEKDVKAWCERMKKVLLWMRDEGEGAKRCQVQF
jgi:tRNA 2-thiouridine synthesizing protein A